MSKDLEVKDVTADLTPLHGPMPYGAGNGSYVGGTELPAWMEPDPPYGPTDGAIDTIARYWSLFIRWPRRLAIGFLWVTYTPWRFGYLVGTAALIVFALTATTGNAEPPTNTKTVQINPEPEPTHSHRNPWIRND